MTETLPPPTDRPTLEQMDQATVARARAMVEGDPLLLLAMSEVWWVALRAGISAGMTKSHYPGPLQLPECPFRPVGAVPLEPSVQNRTTRSEREREFDRLAAETANRRDEAGR